MTKRPDSHLVEWELPDGRREKVPVGIDPGWDYNPGKSRMRGLEEGLKRAESR